MKAYELEATLNGFRGKDIRYQDKRGKLMRWELKEKTLKLVLDSQDIVILAEDIVSTLDAIEVVQELSPVSGIQGNTSMISRINGTLEQIIMENIQKVSESKEAIPQAQEINANVKSLIDLAKAEIEYMKTLAYFHKKK